MKVLNAFRAARLAPWTYLFVLVAGFIGGAVIGACSNSGDPSIFPLNQLQAAGCSAVGAACGTGCCGGEICDQTQTCQLCPGAGAACSAGGGCCQAPQLVCNAGNTCQACSILNAACGAGCCNGLSCGAAGTCQACGGSGAACGVGHNPCCSGTICNRAGACQPEDPTLIVTDAAILNAVDVRGAPIFSLFAVLQQLINNSIGGPAPMTPLQLFQQWWDDENVANQRPIACVAGACENQDPCVAGFCAPKIKEYPHCDDVKANQAAFPGSDTLNGFPIICPRPEGVLATKNPFNALPNPDAFIPVALVNRFDLAPASGENCGEYRIIFAKISGTPVGADVQNRDFIIFEASLPNPNFNQGLLGCQAVVQMWDGLWKLPVNGVAPTQVSELQNFYFSGLTNPVGGKPNFEPVIYPNHYGAQFAPVNTGCSTGQIRTDQFMVDNVETPNLGDSWTLREFKLVTDCRCTPQGEACPLIVVPMSVKQNPYGNLFNTAVANPIYGAPLAAYVNFATKNNAGLVAGDFTSQITKNALASMQPLLLPAGTAVPLPAGAASFGYSTALPPPLADKYNAGESESLSPGPQVALSSMDYVHIIDPGYTAFINGFTAGIPVALNGENIASRARALSCAGCHQLSGALPPNGQGAAADLGFPPPPPVPWPSSLGFTQVSELTPLGNNLISPALQNQFLPNRMTILQDYLNNPPALKPSRLECPRPLPASLVFNCPIPADVDRFPTDAIRTLEETDNFTNLNGFTTQ